MQHKKPNVTNITILLAHHLYNATLDKSSRSDIIVIL